MFGQTSRSDFSDEIIESGQLFSALLEGDLTCGKKKGDVTNFIFLSCLKFLLVKLPKIKIYVEVTFVWRVFGDWSRV